MYYLKSNCKHTFIYGHFLSTWDFPFSSYSCLEIHICWNDPRDASIDPPIHEPNRLSWNAAINYEYIIKSTNTPILFSI